MQRSLKLLTLASRWQPATQCFQLKPCISLLTCSVLGWSANYKVWNWFV